MPFDRERVRRQAAALAAAGTFIGTSSWKYPGWRGMVYDEARYLWHGRFAKTRFERNCLAEYAEVFKTVCVDASYYHFPDRGSLGRLVAQVPGDFLFGFKVPDEITVKRFSNLPRFGERAGRPNENFLNAALFASAFLGPCEPFQRNVGLVIFEFSRFYPADFERGRNFVGALDRFLEQLPKDWPYGVEIRNPGFLRPEYFACLARHGVAHIFNNWSEMPPVAEQMALPGSRTTGGLVGARFLLKPGRKYQEAVDLFAPYDQARELNPEARAAGAALIKEAKTVGPARKTFIYVNNRLEGNSPSTIAAMMEEAGES
jgi:uncharacterized protein YecE (DUF72 family)